ncbi:MAG: hypothetical protein KatS3mg060_1533 [Dehalococcoidia bacterium]|nr:MAG: hypothetical protein KatS3mg060_1533 [Dehalococcoidia bacterium]
MPSMSGRGEAWVVAQGLLFLAYLLAPRLGTWGWPLRVIGALIGAPLLLTGLIFVGYGIRGLGKALSPFPVPNQDGALVTEGIYGCVRHPIYGGIVMASLGFALITGSLGRLLLSFALLGFFAAKSDVEEAWLVERYPDYPSYQARVRRMLPGIW